MAVLTTNVNRGRLHVPVEIGRYIILALAASASSRQI